MPKLTIDLCGGLGNQLFQIFFLIKLSKQYNMGIVLPNKYKLDDKRHTYYDLFPSLCIETKNDNYIEIHENSFRATNYELDNNNNYKFFGYFQSWKYIEHIDPYDYIYFSKELVHKIHNTIFHIKKDYSNITAIHVRRGDYLLAQHFHNILSLEYYKKAVSILEERVNNTVYLIFSDDVMWCKENLNFLSPLYAKDFCENEVEELYAMSLCDNFIIANSSFSYWGAYLCTHKKTVIYPKKWFEATIDTTDLIPENWIMCDNTSDNTCDNISENPKYVYITGSYHHKNISSLVKSLCKYNYTITEDIEKAELVFSADVYINPSDYPNKKFIFGPHFSVFPNSLSFDNRYNNAIYIQPSKQAVKIWKEKGYDSTPILPMFFGVDVVKFSNNSNSNNINKKLNSCFLYYKRRAKNELTQFLHFLANKTIYPKIFIYGQYTEEEYLTTLKESKYGFWLGTHESQGFALEEALSCNVPLLVWNAEYMHQELNSGEEYKNVKMCTVPYWNEECGEIFTNYEELDFTFEKFINKIDTYKPRKFILETLSQQHASKVLNEIILSIQPKREKVSIIIPTYNRFWFLINAINSVINQKCDFEIELIVIDDNSTQFEYDMLNAYIPKNSICIKLNYEKIEGNTARARNIGIKIATGNYIAFLDDDDIWFENKLQIQIEEMRKNKCGMSCTEGYIGSGVYNSNITYKKYISEYFQDFYKNIGIIDFEKIWNRDFLKKHNSCITSSVILRKDIVEKIGYMPYKKVGEDYAYWLKALEHTNCVFINKPLIYYDLDHGDGTCY